MKLKILFGLLIGAVAGWLHFVGRVLPRAAPTAVAPIKLSDIAKGVGGGLLCVLIGWAIVSMIGC